VTEGPALPLKAGPGSSATPAPTAAASSRSRAALAIDDQAGRLPQCHLSMGRQQGIPDAHRLVAAMIKRRELFQLSIALTATSPGSQSLRCLWVLRSRWPVPMPCSSRCLLRTAGSALRRCTYPRVRVPRIDRSRRQKW